MDRREILGAGVGLAAVFPAAIRKALAIPADVRTGTIQDVGQIVILMMENRGFDHYFGSLRGVRGFGDRHPVSMQSGKPVWFQCDGLRDIAPYHLDSVTTSALRVPGTPHSFDNAQAAWNQGKFGYWPKYKTQFSMGHYRRADLPWQFALAEAFTVCDAYHCSVTTGTDPNRVMFWSGSNFDPRLLAKGINCTDADSEPDNLRCWIQGALPEPGYTYAGSALTWPTIPDVLEAAGISWRIYQDPNDNWTGAMHGGLAFESFRTAKPGAPLYEKGMRHWSLAQFAEDARKAALPQVSWVLPPMLWSEHPGPSSPVQGAEFAARVINALTDSPKTWSRTVIFQTFDENDGMFDHVPPPAPPSFNRDGSIAGGSTLKLNGEYFSDPERKHLHPEDTTSGSVRPWGLGPRVPMYVISPWSRGGWINSQVFDHTSVAQFLERRFGITVPAISPWHRAVCGDMTSAFDFVSPNDTSIPALPDARGSAALVARATKLPKPVAPDVAEALFQEQGARPSRPLPYMLAVDASVTGDSIALTFHNQGRVGAVFHVYDKLHLDRIPRRYTVEAGKAFNDHWEFASDGSYNLWILGPNGFLREFQGMRTGTGIEVSARDAPNARAIRLGFNNSGTERRKMSLLSNIYEPRRVSRLWLKPGLTSLDWDVAKSGNWYELLVSAPGCVRRFAGRVETGQNSVSDPAMAVG
ncbi:MAG TPA: phospholipase C, phosphocholine-specific [Rhizomicrobium sp.]|nr:phospholipase C, phosphocholine-specific [Rhizomicrobium sp.]